jgi:hypothetical protein
MRLKFPPLACISVLFQERKWTTSALYSHWRLRLHPCRRLQHDHAQLTFRTEFSAKINRFTIDMIGQCSMEQRLNPGNAACNYEAAVASDCRI